MAVINQDQTGSRTPRWRVPLAIAGVVALLVMVAWAGAYRYFVSEELARAEARLSLYRSTVLAEVERFEHLTQVLSVDPFVIAGLSGGNTASLNARFADFADAAGLDAIYLMTPAGDTIAASNAGAPGSFVGQNYSFRPYFQQALAGAPGRFYGIGATTGLPGYFIADPVRDGRGIIVGVVAIKIDLVPFEQSWREAGEQVLLTDARQVVLLASDPGWRYRVLAPLSPAERDAITASRQFTGQPLEPLDWSSNGTRAWIEGSDRLHLASRNLPHDWQLHYLASDEGAVTRATLAAGAVFMLAALALMLVQFLRSQRLGRALQRSEAEEAGLRRANDRLAREIEDRHRAERRLQETREELERASRLATLGELAASVTHELGQPIAAMRNHLAAHEMAGHGHGHGHGGEGRLASVISGLVERMEGITRQLKFFARTDGEPFEDVDLRDALRAVVDLMQPMIEAEDVTLAYTAPEHPVMARGSRLRLEQVLTNLLRNGIDAMADCNRREMQVGLGGDAAGIWVEISDTGHGLGQNTLAQLREPFFTTRESGQGMGLGLAISARILEEHGGRLEAGNRDHGGARFVMWLPRPAAREMAAE